MLRFVVRRSLLLARKRWRWASRAVVVLSAVRWWRARPRARAVVDVPRGRTLVVEFDDGVR